jgi:uncharacterized protein
MAFSRFRSAPGEDWRRMGKRKMPGCGQHSAASCSARRNRQADELRLAASHSKGASTMKPRITVITIGVDDLERAVRFYRDGLGLKTEGIVGKEFEYGAVAFFDLQAGLKLALWPRKSIAHDCGMALSEPSATEFTLGHNVSSRAEVDTVMEQAQQAGAIAVKPAKDTFWGGYAGYFQDPDRHLWEIVWNPQLLPDNEA